MRVETIGDCTLHLGDCRDVLPTLGKVDAVVTDPPYGLGDKWNGGKEKWTLHHGNVEWDQTTFPDLVPLLLPLADQVIVWGGHLYPFPSARGWLIWDKIVRNFTSGHCEMAWTTIDQPVRAFSYSHGALATEGKLHPTQKPADLMAWCVGFTTGTVLDPFMGVGSTGVACARLARSFVGIEREPKYFDIACRRIEAEYRQPRMFVEPAPKLKQAGLGL